MIRIRKRATPPATLTGRGPAQVSADEASRAAGGLPDANRTIYAAPDVKRALLEDQHARCAWCERPRDRLEFEVEHFRPKSGAHAYWWLAYEWDNLYLSCAGCNRAKRDRFPLGPRGRRARGPQDSLTDEHAQLVRPDERVERHIGFRREVAVGRTRRGAATVATLDLNRIEFLDERRRQLDLVGTLEQLARLGDPGAAAVLPRLRRAVFRGLRRQEP